MGSVPLTSETLAAVDGVILVTNHSNIDHDLILEHSPLIIDSRGVYRDHTSKVRQA
jgi:UDP-N-acetyl-D-glucosamine dehydrogenase